MSRIRPELSNANDKTPCMRNGTAYLMILNAVKQARGLVHGHLHAHGEHCAIGNYFEINKGTCLPSDLIDEVAAMNDSMPALSERQRRIQMIRWLKWKLSGLGMPGFEKAMTP